MFVTDLVRSAGKSVQFRAFGGDPARLLFRLKTADLELWQLRFFDSGFTAWCDADDYKRLPPLVRHTGMRVQIEKKRGLPFFLARYRGRIGIPIGFAVAMVLFLVLCPRIWVIEMQSEDVKVPLSPALQADITDFLEQNGVYLGAKKSCLSPTKIRLTAPAKIEGVGALSVNLSGCVAHVSVMPREPYEKKQVEEATLSNLVATRDGVVRRCEITSGQRVCLINEAVTKGTLLATGIVDTEVGPLLKRATGRVLAETTRTITVAVPFRETVNRPAGKTVNRYTLSAFGLSAPLFTPLSTDGWQTSKTTRSVKLFGRDLPLSVTAETATEMVAVTTNRTKAQAETEAKRRLASAEQTAFAEAEILSRTEALTTDKRGVTLTVTYTVLEDIAEEVPVKVRETKD